MAEEDDRTAPRTDVLADPEWIWVVDPIDGTAEFVRSDGVDRKFVRAGQLAGR